VTDFDEFPEPVQSALNRIWGALSEEQRDEAGLLLKVLEGVGLRTLRWLLEEMSREVDPLLRPRHNVVIVGPANVGKSTLYNQLLSPDQPRAEVSHIPGTTRANQPGEGWGFAIVDTPGADAVGNVGQQERQMALEAAEKADLLVIMFEAPQGVKHDELAMFEEFVALSKPYVVVVNKVDLVGKEAKKVLRTAAATLRLKRDQIIPTVATKGKGLSEVVMAIIKAEPRLLIHIGQVLPQHRRRLAWQRIVGFGTTAALIGLTPLPFLDFIPLSILQVTMVLTIARIYNYRITPARARELLTTFGLGFVGRTLFYELSKLVGLPGWILAAAVAASMTVATGYAAVIWFERGEKLTRQQVQALSRTLSTHLVEILRKRGRRKPSREELEERVQQALDEMPDELKPQGFQMADEGDKQT
jgi:small GTP-binding protein